MDRLSPVAQLIIRVAPPARNSLSEGVPTGCSKRRYVLMMLNRRPRSLSRVSTAASRPTWVSSSGLIHAPTSAPFSGACTGPLWNGPGSTATAAGFPIRSGGGAGVCFSGSAEHPASSTTSTAAAAASLLRIGAPRGVEHVHRVSVAARHPAHGCVGGPDE